MRHINSWRFIIIIVCMLLMLIPFLWLTPGDMDLGGDSNRLYYYDPINFLKSFPIYGKMPEYIWQNTVSYYMIPFSLLLIVLKFILQSSYLLITILNGTYLVAAFLSVYYIIVEIVPSKVKINATVRLAALVGGLYYVLSPITTENGWTKAFTVHGDLFLNPLFFLVFLKFIKTNKIFYALLFLPVSVFFSQNFSPGPNFFAFFPLAFVYLCIYSLLENKSIPFKKIFIFLGSFLAVHLFHLVPLIYSFLFNPNDLFHRFAATTGGQVNVGLKYFMSVLPYLSVTNNLLALTPSEKIIWTHLQPFWIIIPAIVMVGFLCFRKYYKNKNESDYSYPLTLIFFLILFFLVTAKVSNFALEVYKSFFSIPGFTMFRDNWGKFSYTYAFFYTILFGQSLFYILTVIPKKHKLILCSGVIVFFVLSAFPFIRGDLIHIPLDPKYPFVTKSTLQMDPEYEEVLEYIRKDPLDGRFFTVPFNEFFYPMVSGREGGMYLGPSMISYLTGRSDINGYSTMLPFTPTFLDLAKEKDYETIENLFSILNIKYIFHNADESIYKYFPDFPYRSTREALPPDKESIKNFLSNLSVKEKKSFGGKYYIYEVADDVYLPHVYIAKKVNFYDWSKYFTSGDEFVYTTGAFYKNTNNYERRSAYIEETERNKIGLNGNEKNIPNIVVTKVNPTRYLVQVKGAIDPYILVFSETFSPLWKLYIWTKEVNHSRIAAYFEGAISETKPVNKWLNFDTFATLGKKSIAEKTHIRANGYANAWVINPEDVGNKSDYTLVIDYQPQQIFYITMFISILGIIITVWLSLLGFRSLQKNK